MSALAKMSYAGDSNKEGNRPHNCAPAKKKSGPKPLAIDARVVEGMARVGATNVEIADFLGCSPDTIERRFPDVLAKGRSAMRLKLRRMQWARAMKGDTAMLIWLGKQYLDQHDRAQTELTGKAGMPIRFTLSLGERPIIGVNGEDERLPRPGTLSDLARIAEAGK